MGEIDTNNDKDKGACEPRIKTIAACESARRLIRSLQISLHLARAGQTVHRLAAMRKHKGAAVSVSDESPPLRRCLCAKEITLRVVTCDACRRKQHAHTRPGALMYAN